MRFKSVVGPAIALLTISAGCKQESAPVSSAPVKSSALAPSANANAIRGTVAEKIDAGQYSYLKLSTGSGDVWTAVLKTDKKVGDTAAVVNTAWMENFKSATLNRTWERIAFGSLEETASQGSAAPAALPAGHPPTTGADQGMFAAQAAGATGGMHPPPSSSADVGVIKVAKAAGPQGRTVADVYAQKNVLKDKKVAVRAKVVKTTNGVLGKNWLHLRDGTGEGATSDLSVTSSSTAAVGSTVLVTGVVHLDKDLGAGYHYDVIVEDAQIKTE